MGARGSGSVNPGGPVAVSRALWGDLARRVTSGARIVRCGPRMQAAIPVARHSLLGQNPERVAQFESFATLTSRGTYRSSPSPDSRDAAKGAYLGAARRELRAAPKAPAPDTAPLGWGRIQPSCPAILSVLPPTFPKRILFRIRSYGAVSADVRGRGRAQLGSSRSSEKSLPKQPYSSLICCP